MYTWCILTGDDTYLQSIHTHQLHGRFLDFFQKVSYIICCELWHDICHLSKQNGNLDIDGSCTNCTLERKKDKMGIWILMAAAPTALWKNKRQPAKIITIHIPTGQHAFLSYFCDLPWLSTEDNWDHLRFMNKMLCMYTPFELLLF